MPTLSITVPHKLPQEEALRRIQALLAEMKGEYGGDISDLEESWTGHEGRFAFKAMGLHLSGTLSVHPKEVSLNGNLPFAAVPFRGQLERLIRERAEQLLT